MHALLAQECRALAPELARAHGSHALTLELAGMPALPSPLRFGVRLRVDESGTIACDVRARVSELPFADGSIDLLILRHVGEVVADPETLAAEALRVLAADGTVLITGMHPCTLWHPWLRHHAALDSQRLRPVSPGRWRSWLAGAQTEVDSVVRFGPSLPGRSAARYDGAGLLAAGYIVVGRKRHQPPAAIPMASRLRRMPVGDAMPGAARRECA